jgi:hypothetical protein
MKFSYIHIILLSLLLIVVGFIFYKLSKNKLSNTSTEGSTINSEIPFDFFKQFFK